MCEYSPHFCQSGQISLSVSVELCDLFRLRYDSEKVSECLLCSGEKEEEEEEEEEKAVI